MRSILALIKSWLRRIIARFTRETAADNTDAAENNKPNDDNNDPWNDRPGPGPGEIVCYYGCPNSNKAKKLQLKKTAYR